MFRHSPILPVSSSARLWRGQAAALVGALMGFGLFAASLEGAQELADDRSGSEYYFATPVFSDGFESGDTDAWLGPFLLTVSLSGTGSGTITSDPIGIACGADCSEAYNHGVLVTLTASPSGSSNFAGWSGGGCSGVGTCVVSMTAATAVTATFALNQYTLTVSKLGAPLFTGTVTSAPAGIDCGGDCSEDFDDGTSVTLTAVPDGGSVFVGWFGGGCSGTGACTVIMTSATGVTAFFN